MWLDIEEAVMDYLEDLGETGTRLPVDLASHLPFVRARRVGGFDEYRQVTARVVLEVYGSTREQTWQIAEDAAVRLLGNSNFVARPPQGEPVCVDKVTSESANAESAYPDPNIRVVSATYRVVAQRAALAQ